MKPLTWDYSACLTKDNIDDFTTVTMPNQVASKCCEKDEGFGCTLFAGHSGQHEAWGLGMTLLHIWDNLSHPWRH